LQRSAIGTLVERSSRFTMLIHLPREDGFGVIPRTKNGPALAGYGAITMATALAQTIGTLPEQLRRSLTWGRGKELSAHAQFSIASDVKVYFAEPKSPWQRGTNENTGLLRQYFPKGTDLSRWNADDVAAIAHTLNTRPADDTNRFRRDTVAFMASRGHLQARARRRIGSRFSTAFPTTRSTSTGSKNTEATFIGALCAQTTVRQLDCHRSRRQHRRDDPTMKTDSGVDKSTRHENGAFDEIWS
jgi:hypothetical protein